MRVGLYCGGKWDNLNNKFDESKVEVLAEVNDIDFHDRILRINNKTYSLESLNRKNNFATVKEIKIKYCAEDLSSEDNITCPYCNWEDVDSWEQKDDENTIVCSNCGGEFDYIRYVTVSYDSIPRKAPKVKEI